MAELLDSYVDEFDTLAAEVRGMVARTAAGGAKPSANALEVLRRDGAKLLAQAADLLKQMEVEARSTTNPLDRQSLHVKVRRRALCTRSPEPSNSCFRLLRL